MPAALRVLRARGTYLSIAIALILLAVVPQLGLRARTDSSWLLYLAGRILDGDRLYVDVVEANPPLIVWLNLVPAYAARVLGMPAAVVYAVLVYLLALLSVAVCHALLRRLLGRELELRRFLTLLILFCLFPLIGPDYGEREHLMLAATLPYVLLTLVRAEGNTLSRWPALAIGVVAGIGFTLKPYFLLAWLGLEAWLWLATGSRGPKARPESVAVVVVGLVYAVAVARLAPEYLALAPLVGGAYYDYLRNSVGVTALLGEGSLVPVAAMLGFVALRRLAVHRSLWGVLFTATAGFYLAAVLQHKGWSYHYFPAVAGGALLAGLMALDVRRPLASLVHRLYASVTLAVVATLTLVVAAGCVHQALDPHDPRYEPDPDLPKLIPLVRERAAGTSIMVLSWSSSSAFPLVPSTGTTSALRFLCLWILAGLYRDQVRGSAPMRYRSIDEMGALERYLNQSVVEDLERRRPRLLLVLTPGPDRPKWGLRRLDYLAYFGQTPEFVRSFERYRYVQPVGQYWLFERIPESAPPEEPRIGPRAPVGAAAPEEPKAGAEPEALLTILVFAIAMALAWRKEAS